MPVEDPMQREHRLLKALRDKNDYKPLLDAVREVRGITENITSYIDPMAGHPLIAHPQALLAMQEHLAEQGVHKVAFLGHGSSALAVRLNDSEVGRLSSIKEKRRPDIEEYLEPTYRKELAGLCLEVLPHVDTEGVTKEHLRHLVASLIKKGYYPNDGLSGNVGLLRDGTPVYLDADATGKVPPFLLPVAKPIMRVMYRIGSKSLPTESIYQYAQAQERHRQALGIEKGRIGVRHKQPEHEPDQGQGKGAAWRKRENERVTPSQDNLRD